MTVGLAVLEDAQLHTELAAQNPIVQEPVVGIIISYQHGVLVDSCIRGNRSTVVVILEGRRKTGDRGSCCDRPQKKNVSYGRRGPETEH